MTRRPASGMRALTSVELALVLAVIGMLAAVGVVGTRGITDSVKDGEARAGALQVMTSQWEHVSRTGSFAGVDDELQVTSPTQVTGQASTRPDQVSMLEADGELRLAVLSGSGTCLTWHYPDPSAGTMPVEGTLDGQCAAAAVP